MTVKLPHVLALGGIAVLAFLVGLLVPRAEAPPPRGPLPAATPEPAAEPLEAPAPVDAPVSEAEVARVPEWDPQPITMGYADPFVESDAPETPPEPSEPQRGTLSFVGDASWPEYPWPEAQLASLPARSFDEGPAFAPPHDGARDEGRRPPPRGGGGAGGVGRRGGGGGDRGCGCGGH